LESSSDWKEGASPRDVVGLFLFKTVIHEYSREEVHQWIPHRYVESVRKD
jgi:hypothetical protein